MLNEAVSRLQLSGLIGRENPDYQVLFLHDAADRYYHMVLEKRFNDVQKNELDQVAQEFLNYVKVVT